MDRLLKKKTYFALLYVFTALLIEIITFCVMGLGVFPSFWGIDLAFILGLAIIIFVIPSPLSSTGFCWAFRLSSRLSTRRSTA